MSAYYNEFEPFPAQWLRNLIKAGLIAPGEVDERSIKEVKPDDIREFTQCHFFAGIGIWSYALREAGWPDDRPVWTGSCPCQPFSAAGQGKGADDERHLWPDWYELIRALSPERIFGEQVADGDGLDWLDIVYPDMEKAGYTMWINDLCAAGFGCPGQRQRLYFSAVGNAGAPGLSISELENLRRTGRREERGATAEPSETLGDLGDSESIRYNRQSQPGAQPRKQDRRSDISSILASADSEHGRSKQQQQVSERERPREQSCGDSGDGELANTNSRECGGFSNGEKRKCNGSEAGWEQSNGEPSPSNELRGMANSNGNGCDQAGECADTPRHDGTVGDSGLSEGQPQPGPVNGFWRDADWLYCTDGKWRAAQSGTFPLATGATGRVGKIRAYGNAINAEVAKEFIKAAMSVAP